MLNLRHMRRHILCLSNWPLVYSVLFGLLLPFLSGCGFFWPHPEAPKAVCSCIEECHDNVLQAKLEGIVQDLGLAQAAQEHRLSIELVDISDLHALRAAGINSNYIMYAASLPKIAILFGLLKRVEEGTLHWDDHTRDLATQMIRFSSNSAATELFYLVEPAYIASLLTSPSYNLYCPSEGGGLWVGKEYGSAPAWQREPVRQLAHAATAMSVARFYYLLETGGLLSPPLTEIMKDILSNSSLKHKFVKGLAEHVGIEPLCRKSGSWRDYHSDSVIVEHGGSKYIAVALTEDPDGSYWLECLIVKMDQLILEGITRP